MVTAGVQIILFPFTTIQVGEMGMRLFTLFLKERGKDLR
jgi:hypothetical protein